jgi:phosphoribosylanthranilate isomerase
MHPFFSDQQQLRVKICGLSCVEEAEAAMDAGADALGFNFYPRSKRFISLASACQIVAKLSHQAARIAVVVNPSMAEIRSLLEANVWDAIQFHGDETPEFCQNSGFATWMKAVRVSDNLEQTIEKIRSYPTPYILLETNQIDSYGGTGTLVNIPLAARIAQAFPEKNFLLAGGLRPENVREAIVAVHPFAVDVASGVENASGGKDFLKMQAFIQAATKRF